MIQRIQSVFLLIATALLVTSLFLPLLVMINAGNELLELKSLGVYNLSEIIVFPTWGIVSIGGLAAFISFVSIFLFKKRKIQIKVIYGSILMSVFYYVTFWVYKGAALTNLNAEHSSWGLALVFPFVAIIFMFLAIGKIRADEKLVKSLDRIR